MVLGYHVTIDILTVTTELYILSNMNNVFVFIKNISAII
jgi:hypothetical protein